MNGLLRALLRRRQDSQCRSPRALEGAHPAGGSGPCLGVRHSLPDWLAELLGWLPPEAGRGLRRGLQRTSPLDMRVNPLRTTREALLEAFAAAGLAARPCPRLPTGSPLLERTGDLRDLPGYAEGSLVRAGPQCPAIAPLLDPPARPADPGCLRRPRRQEHPSRGADRNDRGEIWAVDRSAARLQRLEHNAERLGLGTIRTLAADAARLAARRSPIGGGLSIASCWMPPARAWAPWPGIPTPAGGSTPAPSKGWCAPAPAAGGAPATAGPGGTACLCHLHGASSGKQRPHRQPAEGPSRLVSPPGTPVVAAACRWGVRGWGRLLRGGAGGAE